MEIKSKTKEGRKWERNYKTLTVRFYKLMDINKDLVEICESTLEFLEINSENLCTCHLIDSRCMYCIQVDDLKDSIREAREG